MSGSELGELFGAWNQHKKVKKESNATSSRQILIGKNVEFSEGNNGLHLIINSPSSLIDYWPSTGLWMVRKTNIKRRGIFQLLKFMGIKP